VSTEETIVFTQEELKTEIDALLVYGDARGLTPLRFYTVIQMAEKFMKEAIGIEVTEFLKVEATHA